MTLIDCLIQVWKLAIIIKFSETKPISFSPFFLNALVETSLFFFFFFSCLKIMFDCTTNTSFHWAEKRNTPQNSWLTGPHTCYSTLACDSCFILFSYSRSVERQSVQFWFWTERKNPFQLVNHKLVIKVFGT